MGFYTAGVSKFMYVLFDTVCVCLTEEKLKKLKNGPQSDNTKRRQIVDQLCEARRECLERLVDSDGVVFENEQSIAVQPSGFVAWINPEQPLSATETQKLIEEDPQNE